MTINKAKVSTTYFLALLALFLALVFLGFSTGSGSQLFQSPFSASASGGVTILTLGSGLAL